MSSFSVHRLLVLPVLALFLLCQNGDHNLVSTQARSLPRTPRNPHFSRARIKPWSTFTASGVDNVARLASPGHNHSPYCVLLAASSTNKVGGYASLTQNFNPEPGKAYNVSFAYKQTSLDNKAKRVAYNDNSFRGNVGKDASVAPVGSITFGVLDPSDEAYLFAETVTMYPLSTGRADSLGNKQRVWHDVHGGQFFGNADEVSYAVVLEPAGPEMHFAVEVDDLVVKPA